MTVYVDDMRRRARVTGTWGTWSHLFADTHHELMAFAAQLDMHPEWLQCPGTHREHFDLVDTKRNQAIGLGAVPISYPRETGALMQAKRAHAELGTCPDGDTVTSGEPLQLALFGEVAPVARDPQRVQMSRQRPWRADHPNVIVVARPTAWGNPFRIGDADPVTGEIIADRAGAVAAFVKANGDRPAWAVAARRELGGRDLACWCPLDEPCHADVLLRIANARGDGVTAGAEAGAASRPGTTPPSTLGGRPRRPAGATTPADPATPVHAVKGI
ncbi:protein of unknown function [Jiangella sp. DSM 45060]|nr:DUF4031 domain-containing protein [Jiangella sp. DSM 45060]SDT36843.1 protein of unknown function [Jiangella sp. DSM 45060]